WIGWAHHFPRPPAIRWQSGFAATPVSSRQQLAQGAPVNALTRLVTGFILAALAVPALAQTFVFTAIPDEDESRLQERFDKVADYLEDKLGVPVKYIPVKSYSAAVTAFRNNQVQLAWFGGLSGVRARQLVPGS